MVGDFCNNYVVYHALLYYIWYSCVELTIPWNSGNEFANDTRGIFYTQSELEGTPDANEVMSTLARIHVSCEFSCNVGRTLLLKLPRKQNCRPIGHSYYAFIVYISAKTRSSAPMKAFLWSIRDGNARWNVNGRQKHKKFAKQECGKIANCSSFYSCSWKKVCARITQSW